MKKPKSITEVIVAHMVERKVSVSSLAAHMGVSRQALTKMLERPYLSTDHLDKICEFFNYDFYTHLLREPLQPKQAMITIPLTKDNSEALLKMAGIKP